LAKPRGHLPEPPLARLLAKIDRTGTCWLWTATLHKSGYGQFWYRGVMAQAHRVAYELLVGPIPTRHELDHIKSSGCTSMACVKVIADEHGPAHLEPVTHAENNRRSDSPSAQAARQTHCKRGHPFDLFNTMWERDGHRRCRICHRACQREYARRRRAQTA
jgi:hypothetical protein